MLPKERRRLEELAANKAAMEAEIAQRQEREKRGERFKYDPVAFINERCWIQPDEGDAQPFLLYPYQVTHISEILHVEPDRIWFENVHHEKSRQLGFSWLYMALELWALSYWPGFRAKNISRKETEVDDGGTAATTDSLHGKILFMWNKLPEEERAPLLFKFLRISRRDGTGFIVGESANPSAGRGGTYNLALMDETAFIPWSERILASVSQACKKGLLLNSTPYGEDGAFARIRFDDGSSEFKKLTTHWSEHPIYSVGLEHDEEGKPTSPWYRKERAKLLPEDAARELDIDYKGSVAARVFPEAAQGMTIGKVKYDPLLPLHLWFDYGMADPTAVIFAQIYRGVEPAEVRLLADYEKTDLVPAEHAENLRAILRQFGFRGDTRALRCHGDPAGNARSLQKKTTLVADYRDEGFIIRSKRSGIQEGIKLCKMLLLGITGTLIVSESCELFIRHIHGNKYPTDQLGNRKQGAEEPDNDEHNHMMSAWRYGMVNNFKIKSSAGSGVRTGGVPRVAK